MTKVISSLRKQTNNCLCRFCQCAVRNNWLASLKNRCMMHIVQNLPVAARLIVLTTFIYERSPWSSEAVAFAVIVTRPWSRSELLLPSSNTPSFGSPSETQTFSEADFSWTKAVTRTAKLTGTSLKTTYWRTRKWREVVRYVAFLTLVDVVERVTVTDWWPKKLPPHTRTDQQGNLVCGAKTL